MAEVVRSWAAVAEKAKRASFLKRGKGLLKKARELAVLCDVPVVVAYFGPGETFPRTWPEDLLEVHNAFSRYRAHPKIRDETAKFIDQPEGHRLSGRPTEEHALQWLAEELDRKINEASARITFLKASTAGAGNSAPPALIPLNLFRIDSKTEAGSTSGTQSSAPEAAVQTADEPLGEAAPVGEAEAKAEDDEHPPDFTVLKL